MSDLYAHVEEGKVTYQGALPKSWRHVSGLDKADPETLASLGWVPLTIIKAEYGEDEEPDGHASEILDNSVVVTEKKRKISPEQAKERAYNKWLMDMKESDLMLPRWGEDLYDALDVDAKARVSRETSMKITDKKTLRAKKP